MPILFFLPFVISPRYLCKLSDQELRQSAARNMADLMWSTVKEPLDTALCFDKESLDLAFKYFMSPTLTMRLAGLSQITVRSFKKYQLCSQKPFLVVLYDLRAGLGGFLMCGSSRILLHAALGNNRHDGESGVCWELSPSGGCVLHHMELAHIT